MRLRKREEILDDISQKDRNVIDLIVEMKNLAGLAIELGFSALLLQDRKLAKKVEQLEEQLDMKQYEIEMMCMMAAKTTKEALGLTSVMRVASAVEDIANAVKELTEVILRGIKPHPTIREALKKAAERVDIISVGKRSRFVGKTIEEATKGKIDAIGLKRKDVWSYMPKPGEVIKAGDALIISGRKRKVKEILSGK